MALALVVGTCIGACNSSGSDAPAQQVTCGNDDECSGPNARCNLQSRVCVECIEDADCSGDAICKLSSCEEVVTCSSSKDCPEQQVCDEDPGVCVDCLTADDCADNETCAENTCRLSCASDKDCAVREQLCATTEGFCVDCREDDDCAETQFCSERSCVTDVCEADYAECADDKLLSCTPAGSGFQELSCASGCSGNPGSATCNDDETSSSAGGATASNTTGGAGAGPDAGGTGGSGGNSSTTTTNTDSASGGTSSTSNGGTGGSTASTTGAGGSTTSTTSTTGGDPEVCGVGPLCGMVGDTCVRRIPVTYRDFNADHVDFEPIASGTTVSGLVNPALSAEGKPQLVSATGNALAHITSSASFAEWYTDGANRATVQGELVLFDDGNGGFVNRYGADGSQWSYYDNLEITLCPTGCDGCAIASSQTCYETCPAQYYESYSCGASPFHLDGTPLFFPLDGLVGVLEDTRYQAKIPEEYGFAGWPWEIDVLGAGPLHNFHFTTEIEIEFVYDASAAQSFEFLGDDDLWVFLDGQLIVDLGGYHVPLAGGFTLDAITAGAYGLVDGQSYQLKVFHAERQTEGSSFMMRLTGFEDCG